MIAVRALLLSFVLCMAVASVAARAADNQGRIPDDIVKRLADFARDQLPNAKLPDGRPVGPEQMIDRMQPYLPMEELRRVVDAGRLSANAAACGLDWQNRSYAPFMAYEKQSGRWNDKQLVYIQLLHDDTEQAIEAKLQSQPCTGETRNRLDAYFRTAGH